MITGWMNQKQDPTVHCPQETHFTGKDKHWQKTVFHANRIWKQAGKAILISNKENFKPKLEGTTVVTAY
jgi:hypothetical protein